MVEHIMQDCLKEYFVLECDIVPLERIKQEIEEAEEKFVAGCIAFYREWSPHKRWNTYAKNRLDVK